MSIEIQSPTVKQIGDQRLVIPYINKYQGLCEGCLYIFKSNVFGVDVYIHFDSFMSYVVPAPASSPIVLNFKLWARIIDLSKSRWTDPSLYLKLNTQGGGWFADDQPLGTKNPIFLVTPEECPVWPDWINKPQSQENLPKLVYRTVGKTRFLTTTEKLEPGDEFARI